MKQKAFVLQNKGMNRDLSISKAAESSAYENHNIRVLARDHDTMLSVTNERGNKRVILTSSITGRNLRVTEDRELRITEDELYRTVGRNDVIQEEQIDFEGILIGWNVLNNTVVLFTIEGTIDRIYRVVYDENGFHPTLLFEGELGFDLNNPIESVVYYETDKIQKIYWVDGRNVLRFMNFAEEPDNDGYFPWQDSNGVYDTTYFDSNRKVDFGVNVTISKDNSGNTRPNGVIQYLLTYYNKHGQESGYVWISDLVYLSPVSSGGSADGTNNNSVTLNIEDLDERFSHFRIYSVFRSALNGAAIAYIVFDGKTDGGRATVVDNNSHLTAIDASQLLYLGSQHVVAGTLTHKDQTLFLGDLSSIDRDYTELESIIKRTMIGENGLTNNCISFRLDDNTIPNETGNGNYAYNSQLAHSSSEITSFKGGEKYRFGIVFHKKDGTLTDAFWIGDAVNHIYPEISDTSIRRVIAECTLPNDVVNFAKENGYGTAQLMIAEPTYADRSIKAQGIVCPTVFNVWNRHMNRLYSAPSWMMRPRNAEYAWKHFEPIHKSTLSTGEIDCNYWETEEAPTPYYALKNYATSPEYAGEFDGQNDFPYSIILYKIRRTTGWQANFYHASALIISVRSASGDDFNISTYSFDGNVLSKIEEFANSGTPGIYTGTSNGAYVKIENLGYCSGEGGNVTVRITDTYNKLIKDIRNHYSFFTTDQLVSLSTFYDWCDSSLIPLNTTKFFNYRIGSTPYGTATLAVNDTTGSHGAGRWIVLGEDSSFAGDVDYTPSYFKRHLTFIDENVVTLNSPEIEYEAISFDKIEGHKFRIVGIAKIDGQYSDYTVEATPGKLSGENLVKEHIGKTLIGWPMWKEFGLEERKMKPDATSDSDVYEDFDEDAHYRESLDYVWSGSLVKYWLRMWNHGGKISGYTDIDNNDYSRLIRKVFANARYSNKTIYYNDNAMWSCSPDSVRIFNYTSSQYVGLDIGKTNSVRRYYDGVLNESLSLPQNHKYPVLYTIGAPNPSDVYENSEEPFLYLSDPVSITYASTAHAVVALPTVSSDNGYVQTILPKTNSGESVSIASRAGDDTGALLPWIDNTSPLSYPYKDYSVVQDSISNLGVGLDSQYVYIGEIYAELEDGDQIRYGGTSDAAIQNNRFIIAGPQYLVSEMNGSDVLIANQGDTYIQRWDCLKTKPYSSDCVNNVIDITSVMLETHINIDGRTDLQRGTSYIASLDAEKFGSLNPGYSQNNNFVTQRDLDEDFNLDSYRSSITWTLEKHDSEDVDAWSHITLASTLKLDGDKGICRALRRLQNSIISFQDRGISEILFNSRTQLSTQDGVPVEIANSGKVDGKRYITNKYGCTNKWSIVEGKNALYFVDNINKAFCSFNGQAIESLSTKLGFSAWFREINDTNPWRPIEFNNIVSYYDKIHSDIYLVRNTNDDMPCLVYSENLGAFTSFFDYSAVLMMTNVEDRFLSYKNHALWLQNEGLYCNFFGHQYDYWMQYRVTPEPFSDKIWTNIDYRADFYQVLDENGIAIVPEENLINGDTFGQIEDLYKEWETFTDYKVWDEYQTTGFVPFAHQHFDRDDVRKKFRIWRLTVPRALKEGTNRYGMDRIRNPWINLMFRKSMDDNKNLMQLHDIVVKYFE